MEQRRGGFVAFEPSGILCTTLAKPEKFRKFDPQQESARETNLGATFSDSERIRQGATRAYKEPRHHTARTHRMFPCLPVRGSRLVVVVAEGLLRFDAPLSHKTRS